MALEPFLDRQQTISVCLPARNEEATIGAALAPLTGLKRDGFIDQIVVVDESTDATADIAASMGPTEVHRQSALCPELGPVRGKGDAMWRALTVLTGDVILFLDADSTSIQRHYVLSMCAPILTGHADLVKAHYRRPLGADPDGGGRVNHLLARPLLAAHFPALAHIRQPLAGESALSRHAARSLPFITGYGVEVAMLIDAHRHGYRIAQANLHRHEHRHRPLADLSEMAEEILAVVLDRAGWPQPNTGFDERPPMSLYEREVALCR